MPARSTSKSTSAGRKRRGRRHPGVVLIKPDLERRIGWRARWTDPDTRKIVKETLNSSLSTTELRVDWAVRKSKALVRRQLELEQGAPRATGTRLCAAVERYFEDHPHLRERTRDIYRRAAKKLLEWASAHRVEKGDDITLARLVAFRAWLIRQPRLSAETRGKRGAMKATGEPRKPGAVNVDLRAIRTILNYLRRLGLLARITSDALADGLAKLSVTHEQGAFLRPREIQRVLRSALAHDRCTFAATREEHAARVTPGETRRYDPIAPLIATAILTGMRIGELLDLEWSQVDLRARGDGGQMSGEIYLSTRTKTKKPRTVGLEVSPALRELLVALRSHSEVQQVFPLSNDTVKSSMRRLGIQFNAPAGWSWNTLRRTCGTFLTCAPGIFGAASAYRSARQLGHSVAVAEKHYVGVLRGLSPTARSLETAMGIEVELAEIMADVRRDGAVPATGRRLEVA